MSARDTMRQHLTDYVVQLKAELKQAEEMLASFNTNEPVQVEAKPKTNKETPADAKAQRAANLKKAREAKAAKAAANGNGGESTKRQSILALLSEGVKPSDIAEITGAKVGYVYSLKRELTQ